MRVPTRLLAVVPLLGLGFGAAACPSSHDDGGGSLVVGVQADDFGNLVGAVRVVVKQDGTVVRDETLAPPSGAGSPLPKEVLLTGPAGARVEVTADALPIGGGLPLFSRLASARLVASASQGSAAGKLLRVQLQNQCITFPAEPPGAVAGVACAASLTCIAGACGPSEVGDDALEDYEKGWALAPPDVCRPAKHGPPEVIAGTGQTDYATLGEGQILQLEKGPQGGHHIWIAARMKNLRQSGSTTTITSRIEGDPEPVPPLAFVFTYERDEGSYCKVWGLRYQVDVGASDLRGAYKRFLGKRLVVTVEVLDATGARASSTRTVQLGEKLLCPDGTNACNP